MCFLVEAVPWSTRPMRRKINSYSKSKAEELGWEN